MKRRPSKSDGRNVNVAIADEQDIKPTDSALVNRLTEAVRVIASDYQFDQAEISIAVLDDLQIREINKKYLEHDWATDVITFPLGEEDDDEYLEGEIVVSRETADREAKNQTWTGDDELLLYVIHGMLHLVGFDDSDDESRIEMKQHEREYLVRFEIPGAALHS